MWDRGGGLLRVRIHVAMARRNTAQQRRYTIPCTAGRPGRPSRAVSRFPRFLHAETDQWVGGLDR